MVNEGTHRGFGRTGGAQTNKHNPYFVDVLGKRKHRTIKNSVDACQKRQ